LHVQNSRRGCVERQSRDIYVHGPSRVVVLHCCLF
jgi:hypothetical protein